MTLDVKPNVIAQNWSNNNPNELDYLRPNAFKFQIHNIPNTSYFCNAANIPEVNLPPATQTTPFVDVGHPGDKLDYGTLMIRFLIQEDMKNFSELYDWMVGLGFPEDYKQAGEYAKTVQYKFPSLSPKDRDGLSRYSDASLILLDSNNNPKVKFTFVDAFPVSLQGLDFEISTGSTEYMTGVAMFKYSYYEIETF